MGGLSIGVVMLFPNGPTGIRREYAGIYVDRLPGFGASRKAPPPAVPSVAIPELGYGQ
jgi:hypothetical protein